MQDREEEGRQRSDFHQDDDEEDTIEDEYYRAEMDGDDDQDGVSCSSAVITQCQVSGAPRTTRTRPSEQLQGNNTTVRNETHLKILDIHLEDIQTNNLAEQRERFVQSLADTRDLVNPFQQQSSDPLQVGNW
eukprot:766522-Hanusia_phi.AAC.3